MTQPCILVMSASNKHWRQAPNSSSP